MSTIGVTEPSRPSIAIVDDEADLREAVVEFLRMEGFQATGAADAQAFRKLAASKSIDAVILDVAMPGEDGLSLARWIRSQSSMGIIFLTASGRPIDKIAGFELGADDYMVKPFALRELLARLKGLLRRMPAGVVTPIRPPADQAIGIWHFGGCAFNPTLSTLTRNGSAGLLTSAETQLLVLLITNPGRVFTRSQLAAAAAMSAQNDRAVDSAVVRLRRKIELDPASPQHLKTVRGEGYRFEAGPP